MSAAIQVFDFETQSIQLIERAGEPWFVAKDLCEILGLDNVPAAVGRLDDDERDAIILNDSVGRENRLTIVSESGMYSLVLGSRKPIAKKLKRWVTHDVLPAIRKTGRYELQPVNDEAAFAPSAAQIEAAAKCQAGLQIVREARLLGGKRAAIRAWLAFGIPDVFDQDLKDLAGPEPDALEGVSEAVLKWFDACAERAEGARTRSMDLWTSYRLFYELPSTASGSVKWFAKQMELLGFPSIKSDQMYRLGIRLK